MRTDPPLLLFAASVLFVGCGGSSHADVHAASPAHVVTQKSGPPHLELTPTAAHRIGLKTTPVASALFAPARVVVPGSVVGRPGGRADLRAPIGGTLLAADLAFAPGTQVKAGQWIARLLPLVTPQRFVGIEARAAQDAAQARVEAAKANATRVAGLRKDGAMSARALEQAQADLTSAEAQLVAAKAQSKRLRKHALDADVVLPIRAPITGTIVSIGAPIGQLVDPGTPLVSIIDTEAPWVEARVFPGDVSRLDRETPARVRLLGAETWVPVSLAAQPELGVAGAPSVAVLLTPEPGTTTLVPGARVEVELPLKSAAAPLSVPASALFYDALGKPQVYVAIAEHTFVRKAVHIVREDGERVLLSNGPEVGEMVVVAGVPELIGAETGVGH